MNFNQLVDVLETLRSELGRKDIPLPWVEFFLRVAAAGDLGITTQEVAADIGMAQGVASRMVKIMSKYLDTKTRKMEGHDVFVTIPNYEHLLRQRVALSTHGKEVVAKIVKKMNK